MSKCVFRTDLRNQPVSEFLPCIDPSELFFQMTAPTVEECVHMLIGADEICLGSSNRREILQGARLVGYIRIVDAV
ncbi:MAG: hypothetical protein ABUU24_02905 [Variovorax sp.]